MKKRRLLMDSYYETTVVELWLHLSVINNPLALLYIAKRPNSIHKRLWDEAVSPKSFGIAIGLHRDAELIEKSLVVVMPFLSRGFLSTKKT